MSRAGRVAGSESGENGDAVALFAPRDERQQIAGGDRAREPLSSHPMLPDIENEPEPEPGGPEPEPEPEPDLNEPANGSESESEGENAAVIQPGRARSQNNSRRGTAVVTNRNQAELGYEYGYVNNGSSHSGVQGCPIIQTDKRDLANGNREEGGGKRRKVVGGNGTDKKFVCQVEWCNYRSAHKGTFTRHMANIHDVGVVWYHCGINGCKYKAKLSGNLNRHKSMVHDIDITWHHCDVVGCKYKTKRSSDLKQHKMFAHDIGVLGTVAMLLDATIIPSKVSPTSLPPVAKTTTN